MKDNALVKNNQTVIKGIAFNNDLECRKGPRGGTVVTHYVVSKWTNQILLLSERTLETSKKTLTSSNLAFWSYLT